MGAMNQDRRRRRQRFLFSGNGQHIGSVMTPVGGAGNDLWLVKTGNDTPDKVAPEMTHTTTGPGGGRRDKINQGGGLMAFFLPDVGPEKRFELPIRMMSDLVILVDGDPSSNRFRVI